MPPGRKTTVLVFMVGLLWLTSVPVAAATSRVPNTSTTPVPMGVLAPAAAPPVWMVSVEPLLISVPPV